MRTRAIIIKKQNTGEYDQLVTCYTEEFGKVTAVAKSVLKPGSIQAMHLDIFNLVDFELINGRAIPIITGAQAEQTYPSLKNNLQCLATAYFFAETADKLFFEYQKDDEIWDFFTALFSELDIIPHFSNYNGRHCNLHGSFLRDKQITFLSILGYAPNLNECTFCSTPMEGRLLAYSIEDRGAICQDCFLNGRQGVVLKNGIWQSTAVIEALFESLAERKLNSLNFLNSMLES